MCGGAALRDLTQRTHLHGLEQLRENIAATSGDGLQAPQRFRRFAWRAGRCTASTCRALFLVAGAEQRRHPRVLSFSLRKVFTPTMGSEPSPRPHMLSSWILPR
jgi:hypothetical protein